MLIAQVLILWVVVSLSFAGLLGAVIGRVRRDEPDRFESKSRCPEFWEPGSELAKPASVVGLSVGTVAARSKVERSVPWCLDRAQSCGPSSLAIARHRKARQSPSRG